MSVLRAAFRGGISALRGYTDAKVAVQQAKNEQERYQAQVNLQKRQLQLQEHQLLLDHSIAQQKHNEEIRQFNKTDETKRWMVETDIEGKKWLVDAQGGYAVQVAQTQAGATTEAAKTGADAQKEVAKTRAGAEVDVANINQTGANERAEGELGYKYDALNVQESLSIEQMQNLIKLKEMDQQIAREGYASAETIANIKAVAEGLGATADLPGSQLTKEQLSSAISIISRMETSREAKFIKDRKNSYIGGLTAYVKSAKALEGLTERDGDYYDEQGNKLDMWPSTGYNDIAMLNFAQRLWDPGVAVREGDITVLQSVTTYSQQFLRYYEQLKDDKLLFPQQRQALAELILDMWNQFADEWNSPESEREMFVNLIDKAGLQEAIKMPQYYRQAATLPEIVESGNPAMGWGWGQAPTGPEQPVTPTDPNEASIPATDAPTAPDNFTNTINQMAAKSVELGVDEANIIIGINSFMDKRGITSEERRARIRTQLLEEVNRLREAQETQPEQQQPTEGQDGATPEEPTREGNIPEGLQSQISVIANMINDRDLDRDGMLAAIEDFLDSLEITDEEQRRVIQEDIISEVGILKGQQGEQ